ncbi:hypothetical protein LCGC14_2013390, partial [marine sediment metagenome]
AGTRRGGRMSGRRGAEAGEQERGEGQRHKGVEGNRAGEQ